MRTRLTHKIAIKLLVASLLCFLAGACRAQTSAPVLVSEHGPNSPQQISKHYVVLVSLDGFRYDYAKLYQAKIFWSWRPKGPARQKG